MVAGGCSRLKVRSNVSYHCSLSSNAKLSRHPPFANRSQALSERNDPDNPIGSDFIDVVNRRGSVRLTTDLLNLLTLNRYCYQLFNIFMGTLLSTYMIIWIGKKNK